jgi:hypothetical protein
MQANSSLIEWLRKKGVVGPLWIHFSSMQRLWPHGVNGNRSYFTVPPGSFETGQPVSIGNVFSIRGLFAIKKQFSLNRAESKSKFTSV